MLFVFVVNKSLEEFAKGYNVFSKILREAKKQNQ